MEPSRGGSAAPQRRQLVSAPGRARLSMRRALEQLLCDDAMHEDLLCESGTTRFFSMCVYVCVRVCVCGRGVLCLPGLCFRSASSLQQGIPRVFSTFRTKKLCVSQPLPEAVFLALDPSWRPLWAALHDVLPVEF